MRIGRFQALLSTAARSKPSQCLSRKVGAVRVETGAHHARKADGNAVEFHERLDKLHERFDRRVRGCRVWGFYPDGLAVHVPRRVEDGSLQMAAAYVDRQSQRRRAFLHDGHVSIGQFLIGQFFVAHLFDHPLRLPPSPNGHDRASSKAIRVVKIGHRSGRSLLRAFFHGFPDQSRDPRDWFANSGKSERDEVRR